MDASYFPNYSESGSACHVAGRLPIRWKIQLQALRLWMKRRRYLDRLGNTVIGEEGLGSLLYRLRWRNMH